MERDRIAAELARLHAEQAALSVRLGRLEGAAPAAPAAPPAPGPAPDSAEDPLWLLRGIEARHPAPGAVYFAGSVAVAEGPVRWQLGRPTEELLESDWSEHAAALAALASPVRLTILQAFLGGATSAAELSAAEGLGTTGQLYHHLNQLVAQGWLRARGRGHYAIPAERVVPLLAIVAAVGSPS